VCVCVCDQERQRIRQEKQRRDEERRVREMQLMTQKAIDKHNQLCQKPISANISSQVSWSAELTAFQSDITISICTV